MKIESYRRGLPPMETGVARPPRAYVGVDCSSRFARLQQNGARVIFFSRRSR